MRPAPMGILYCVAAAIVTVLCSAGTAVGQMPIAVKELQVEMAPDSLSKPHKLANSARTVSSECRNQFVEAKAKDTTLVSFGCVFPRLSLQTSAMATEYFGGFEVGNAIAFTYGDEQGTLYTQLLSDNLWLSAWLGYARVGLSTQLAAAADSAREDTTLDQLFQGGGNALVHATIPLAVWINFVGETDVDMKPVRSFNSFLTIATGMDIPEMNAAAEAPAGSARASLSGLFTWRTANEDFRFFAQGNAAYVVGFSDEFYDSLVPENGARPKAGLGLLKGTVGVELAKRARVGISFGTTTLSGVRQSPRLSVQLIDAK